ncbi:MAG: leucine--tRNA ligase [Kofleriaceae bacterium]|nr:leucine--tRNA ligase [Myxococcales bacterium]MCB9560250.1 leucine--tRNA ligase [Kofleriaceae bacterium]MCB9571185.1 leucine--tRNA ligase [Kofleriaceae bacterium]
MAGFDHRTIDGKWQARWERDQTFATPTDRTRPKYYVLDMFPYPSGSGLHVGHPKGYTATDVVARARRMMGFNVLRVMGWDSFGLPAERQAEKENIHPREITARNIATFKQQLSRLGLSYDWSRELATSDPRYYKWTQWIFLELWKQGLAYRAEVPVNFCPALGTVLANEEVKDGVYIETGDPVERRLMKQWMLRITAFADRLIDDLDGLDWPHGTLEMQRHWIGRSIGANVIFDVVGSGEPIEVFTTRPDTLFGGTYVVLAPEHPLVATITTDAQRAAVEAYQAEAGKRSERDRLTEAADAPKTGAFTGAFAVNPVNGKHIPIWIADYVLASYGTGAVFACPGHDERDWAFARAFDLPIIEVVQGGDVDSAAYVGDGVHVNSGFLDGLTIDDAKTRVIAWLAERGKGEQSIRYRLRDWLFSRQRYWGEPFPTIELEDGTVKVLSLADLPVELPELDDYRPASDGRPPLARATQWMSVRDPETGAPATRETNTMPQWAGSCWYYLRFLSPHRDDVAWDAAEEQYWMPVDLYVGGSEHATLHLLYARFWHKVLFDAGLVHTKEPFQRLFHQGMIHKPSFRDARGKYYYDHEVEKIGARWVVKGSDTAVDVRLEKMSKSKYNVVNPDDMCDEYGADALRLYELFMGPLEDGTEWATDGVSGCRRFLDRTWRLAVGDPEEGRDAKLVDDAEGDREVERALHAAIKKVGEAVDNLRMNVAIAEMMVFVNEATRADKLPRAWFESFVKVLSPFAPHLAEELWERLGHAESIAYAPWPAWDEAKLKRDTITIAVQVSGKMRGTIEVAADAAEADILAAAKADDKVQPFLAGKAIRREIYVKGRLVNLVV